MPAYHYTPLSTEHGSIRLLRLLPNKDRSTNIECELFEYALDDENRDHQYDALSYVWGNPGETLPVFIDGCRVHVTANLHAALSSLRNHRLDRVFWIDAICINQNDNKEKGDQIQSMAKIYSRANRVVVWLGEAANDSDLVIEAIRSAGGKKRTITSDSERIESAGQALLQRPWFRRIWILQEVAAARSIQIACGSGRIDGYAFCLGFDSLNIISRAQQRVQGLISSVTYLIRNAMFRPGYSNGSSNKLTLGIHPLGGLIDMYHAHEATKKHDKVYALLGMCSDDPSKAGLFPDYDVTWDQLLQRLLKYLISDQISVKTWGDRQAAVIGSRGHPIGRVVSVEPDPIHGDRQRLKVRLIEKRRYGKDTDIYSRHWILQATAIPIQPGDFVCLLRGASAPTIIRLCKDYFTIIDVPALKPTDRIPTMLPDRTFILVWDWETRSQESQEERDYETCIRKIDCRSEQPELGIGRHHARATRSWHIAQILGDTLRLDIAYAKNKRSGSYSLANIAKTMECRGREAVNDFEMAIKHAASGTFEDLVDRMPLDLAVEKRYSSNNALPDFLLSDFGLNLELETRHKGPKPLLWAVQGGHDAFVELLLHSTHKRAGQLLLQAAKGGHTALVRLLLEEGKINIDMRDKNEETPLFKAANCGHDAIVELLLKSGKTNINRRNRAGETPLFRAAVLGHVAVVRLLLETDGIEINIWDDDGRSLLSSAVKFGHTAVVRLLLTKGKANVEISALYNSELIRQAAERGHAAVLELLLETGKFNVDGGLSKKIQGQIDDLMPPAQLRDFEMTWGSDMHQPEKSALEDVARVLLEASKNEPR
ncbi:hypothetical protein FB567DRAFT_571692 [Paraphoma chrysanthemicola]|uniref:Heterokaryon incompatibility domain-containing protein n=1 Tax=Paraphoma chrysanthemicola TaxID=798071 RepID=A0A8K0R1D6_9PLEO|nr:hypothetical protein FB567DRAFT_571692 [Paraphoma chrysanthemicola]